MLAHGSPLEVHVWDLPAFSDEAAQPVNIGAPSLTLRNPRGGLRSLAFSRDGRELRAVTGTSITTWDATLRDAAPLRPDVITKVNRSTFSPDATRFAEDDRGGIGIWESSTGRLVSKIPGGQRAFGRTVTFSPDGRQLAIIGAAPNATEPRLPARMARWLWLHNVEDGRQLARFQVDSVAPTPGPRRGTTGRDFSSQSVLPSLMCCFRPDNSQVACVTFTPGATGLAQLRVWDLKNNVELPPTELPWPTGRVLGYSADGAKLHVASVANAVVTVATFDAENRELRTSRDFPGNRIFARLFDPRHNLVPVGDNGDLVLYEIDSGNVRSRLARLSADDSLRYEVVGAINPDGSRMAVTGESGFGNINSQITVWSLQTGRKLVGLDAPLFLDAMAFSSDGQRLLMRSRIWPSEQPAEVWDGAPFPDGK
jgi:WD40 repeat protein